MNNFDKNMIKTINLFLSEDILGIDSADINDEQSHILQFEREYIKEIFYNEIKDSTYKDSIMQAFNHVHGYKYVTDPHFGLAMYNELSNQGIPEHDKDLASEALWNATVEIGLRNADGDIEKCEKDVNWNPSLEKIMKQNEQTSDR